MKRSFCIALALVFILALVGCAGSGADLTDTTKDGTIGNGDAMDGVFEENGTDDYSGRNDDGFLDDTFGGNNTYDTNNGTTNGSTANNGTTNNGTTNGGTANNGTTNNGTANNGTTTGGTGGSGNTGSSSGAGLGGGANG